LLAKVKPRAYFAYAVLAVLGAGCSHVSAPVVSARQPDVTMVLESFDEARLSRAIFEETNRVRVLHGQTLLKPDPGLNTAADEQAVYTALVLKAGHDNPMPGERNVAERVARQDENVVHVGENAIMMPAVRLRGSGEPFYGYREFAAILVDGWMNSPAHRANMLSDKFTMLGCAARLSHAFRKGDFRVFAIQVFARPAS
jgi:uncharacterized protein YkwD